MSPRRTSLVLAVAIVLTLALLPTRATAEDRTRPEPASGPLWSYTEDGCTEIAFNRGGRASAVRPLVPARFALDPFLDDNGNDIGRVRLAVNEVTCDRARFSGFGAQRRPYSYILVSAFVTATEGDQRDGAYVLFYASENRAQREAFRRLGWPLTGLGRRTTSTLTRDGDGNALAKNLHVVGGGWDHDAVAVAAVPQPRSVDGSVEYYRDTDRARLTLCFTNRAVAAGAVAAADLRTTPFATVSFASALIRPAGADLVEGGWDVTVVSGACPTA